MELKEHDIVEVKKDGQHVKKGEQGTIVHIYPSGDFEVEFGVGTGKEKVVLLIKDEVKAINQPKKGKDGKQDRD